MLSNRFQSTNKVNLNSGVAILKYNFEPLTYDYVIVNGVEYDNLYWEVNDDRAYTDENSSLFNGITYELGKDKELFYYSIYKDGFTVETVDFYRDGSVSKHATGLVGARWKVEKWHPNGVYKEISYIWCGNEVAYKKWDENGNLIDKRKWKEDICICASETMKKEICSQKMTEEECLNMQKYLKDYILQEAVLDKEDIKCIAGVDLAYWQEEDGEHAVCCIALVDCNTHKVIERVHSAGIIKFPYIAGYLAFRELPLVLETAGRLSIKPDIYMFDGNGILHPQMMGIATHASFFLQRPTIGVAKSYYKINNTEFIMPDVKAGSFTDIVIDRQVLGRALRTMDNVQPVFVSSGNCIDLDSAVTLVMHMVGPESHIPIPTREADIDTHKARQKNK